MVLIILQDEGPNLWLTHCRGTEPVQEQGLGTGSMGSLSCRNVHTGPRQRQGQGRIVSYCACPIPCTGPVLGPVQCI